MEVWKDINGYKSKYQISNLGNVKSLSRFINNGIGGYISKERILKLAPDRVGYSTVTLMNGNRKQAKVHRLVAEHFIDNAESKLCVNHINFIKSDNRVENLEWCTHKENAQHSISNNKFSMGNRHYNTKITDEQVLEIRHLHSADLKTYEELAELYNTNCRYIKAIVKRRKRKYVKETK
jgi:hypothetical protein